MNRKMSDMTLEEYLATSPPEDDTYWDDQIWDMTIALDLKVGMFGRLPPDRDAAKCIAYHLRRSERGEEIWARLRRERPELFQK